MVVVFRFDYSDRLSVVEVKHIVGELRFTASHDISTDIDVLETMLKQDGLIDSGMKGNK